MNSYKQWECDDCDLGQSNSPCTAPYDKDEDKPDSCVYLDNNDDCNWQLKTKFTRG
jgi:hypothetical protein